MPSPVRQMFCADLHTCRFDAITSSTESHELLPKSDSNYSLTSGSGAIQRSLRSLGSPGGILQRNRSDVHSTLSLEEGPQGKEMPIEATNGPDRQRTLHTVCGVDTARLFPTGLLVILLAGGAYTLTIQCQLVEDILGDPLRLTRGLGCSYGLTLCLATYAGICDPGQLDEEASARWRAGLQPLPRRAHKNFLYSRPVLRFDHYCRWLMNCIGLKNHREFVVMMTGLFLQGLAGAVLDGTLLHIAHYSGANLGYYINLFGWQFNAVSLHLAFMLALLWHILPIWRLHLAFVSRNELASEWKTDKHYVLSHPITGELVAVTDLSQEMYDQHFDDFEYDPTRNPFDMGCRQNWRTFCCTPRWAPGQLGEF